MARQKAHAVSLGESGIAVSRALRILPVLAPREQARLAEIGASEQQLLERQTAHQVSPILELPCIPAAPIPPDFFPSTDDPVGARSESQRRRGPLAAADPRPNGTPPAPLPVQAAMTTLAGLDARSKKLDADAEVRDC